MSSSVSSMVGPVKNVIIMRKDILCVVIVQSCRSELEGFRLAGGGAGCWDTQRAGANIRGRSITVQTPTNSP